MKAGRSCCFRKGNGASLVVVEFRRGGFDALIIHAMPGKMGTSRMSLCGSGAGFRSFRSFRRRESAKPGTGATPARQGASDLGKPFYPAGEDYRAVAAQVKNEIIRSAKNG